jgi:uncharacterized protein YbjT (DUF2867 family)
MTNTILVTGGTGTLGRQVVPLLRDRGATVRVLSRHSGDVTGDLLTGEGVRAALDGADTVVHLAGDARHDEETTNHLVRAAQSTEIGHLIFISVINADKIPVGYYRHKAAAERIVAESGLPWTTLRAAQFYDLTLTFARAMAKSPIVPVPDMRWQPVDARDVAERLADLAFAAPAGLVPDIAGPRIYPLRELVRGYLEANGKRRLTFTMPLPGAIGRVYRAGDNLNPSADQGVRTWEAYLAERVRG